MRVYVYVCGGGGGGLRLSMFSESKHNCIFAGYDGVVNYANEIRSWKYFLVVFSIVGQTAFVKIVSV